MDVTFRPDLLAVALAGLLLILVGLGILVLTGLRRARRRKADTPQPSSTATPSELAVPATEQSEAYLRQVALVVRALAEHTGEDESPRRTLARVAAAIERLGVPNELQRPILPEYAELGAGPRPEATLASPVRPEIAEAAVAIVDLPVEPAPVPVEPTPTQPEPTVHTGPPAHPEPNRVLPVPPPATSEASAERRRGRVRRAS